jgi:hypothetical protein
VAWKTNRSAGAMRVDCGPRRIFTHSRARGWKSSSSSLLSLTHAAAPTLLPWRISAAAPSQKRFNKEKLSLSLSRSRRPTRSFALSARIHAAALSLLCVYTKESASFLTFYNAPARPPAVKATLANLRPNACKANALEFVTHPLKQLLPTFLCLFGLSEGRALSLRYSSIKTNDQHTLSARLVYRILCTPVLGNFQFWWCWY